MQILELFEELSRAYTAENLNRLSSGIIALYKNRDVSSLRKIHYLMFSGNHEGEDKVSRLFSKIITHYHPDRQEQINRELRLCLERNDLEGMKKFDHILDIQNIEFDASEAMYYSDLDEGFEDAWDPFAEGYSFIDDEDRDDDDGYYNELDNILAPRNFANAVKRKVYGTLDTEFPYHLLADMEILEMAGCDIDGLEGIEYCYYARIVDLSSNNLTEITGLSQLIRLEEVYLQNNNIASIDVLIDLPYLRVVDISYNDIRDISALFECDTLEFVNLIGNRVPDWQLEKLHLSGVIVVS